MSALPRSQRFSVYIVLILIGAFVLWKQYEPLREAQPLNFPRQTITLVSPRNDTVTVQAQVVSTLEDRKKGLMYREELGENEGMLFVHEDEHRLRFWMMNVQFPLDVIAFNKRGIAVDWQQMETCDESCTIYGFTSEAQYALELPLGFLESNNIDVGWKIENVEQFLE